MNQTGPIEALANQLVAGTLAPIQLPRAMAEVKLTEIPLHIWNDIDIQRNHSPRLAHALALVAQELASKAAKPHIRAQANLALILTLNTLGEFREAINRCEEGAHAFLDLQDAESAARVWLEAAWAETYLGNLDPAREYLSRAQALLKPDGDVRLLARAEWVEGRILRAEGGYAQAQSLLEHAQETFISTNEFLDAARCQREIGHTIYLGIDPAQAVSIFDATRMVFEEAKCPAEVALCDNFLGQACRGLGRYEESLTRFAAARKVFTNHGMQFFAAICDLDSGFSAWHLNQYEAALSLLQSARDCFLQSGAESEASSCEINIGVVLIELNRYEEAIPRLQRAAAQAVAERRDKKTAVCFVNLGWAADRQGYYSQALAYYHRARAEFARGEVPARIAWCDRNLGLTYFNLGQYEAALTALERAREICIAQNLQSDLAECELYRAQVLLRSNMEAAVESLQKARALFAEAKQTVYVAFCDRVLASAGLDGKRGALARLEQSRAVFIEHGQLVDAALCDLTRGELHLSWRQWKKAQEYLQSARQQLRSGFPDQAWRADYMLGKVAVGQKDNQAALHHYLTAVQSIAKLRAGLRLEQLSNSVFGARDQVFADALTLSQAEREDAKGLAVIEAAKAQIFLSYLVKQDWQVQSAIGEEIELAALIQQERELRFKLDSLRRQSSIQVAQAQGEALRGAEARETIPAHKLKELNALSQAYETVVARLRLMKRGLAGVPALAPFSLGKFRKMAQARWGKEWAALDYYLDGKTLTIAYLDSQTVALEAIELSPYDQFVLQQCTGTLSDLRELVYRGTIRGTHAPTSSTKYLQYLMSKLIPERLHALIAHPGSFPRSQTQPNLKGKLQHDNFTLIISPHSILHQLPFHALMDGDTYLIDHFAFVFTPSLQALAELGRPTGNRPAGGGALLCGLDEFGPRAHTLSWASQELEALRANMDLTATVMWKEAAQRQAILDLSESGNLVKFEIIHFATHAVAESHAPHWSRILLADDDLTVWDIMNLKLNARLVTLSACSTGLGEGGRGDEFIGFAHAFFYAGARALIASLWAVEDKSTSTLMSCFYSHLKNGAPIAQALRQAQLELKQAGFQPFQWAPFVAIGNV